MPTVQRYVYLYLTLVQIASITGMHDTPKRNILLESISSMFLVLNNLITSLRDYSSELVEHNFGMLQQRTREFTICQLAGLLDSIKRYNTIMHKHNQLHSFEEQKGYNETLCNFLASICNESPTRLCKVKYDSDIPVANQLFEHLKPIIDEGYQTIIPLLN